MRKKVVKIGKGKKHRKALKPTTNVLTSQRPKPGIRCRICNRKHEKYLPVFVLAQTTDKGPQPLSALLCLACGGIFVQTEMRDQIIKSIETPRSPIIKPGDANFVVPK